MAVRERNKVFELVTLKGDSGGQQKRSNVYQDITPETLAQPQNEDSTLRKFESESEQTNRSEETLEDYNNKNTSIYKRIVTFMIVLAVILIIASLIIVFSLAIYNSLTSSEFKAYSAIEFQVMMEHIDQVNLSVFLLNEFYEYKSSKQQEHLLNLTAQNKEMMKTLENLNNSLSRRLLSQASGIQNLNILTAQNRENISVEKNRVNSVIRTVKRNISQLMSNVASEIRTIKGNVNRLRIDTSSEIRTVTGNVNSQLRRNIVEVERNIRSDTSATINSVRTTAGRADRRIAGIAGRQVLTCSTVRYPRSTTLHNTNNTATISSSYTLQSVSYKTDICKSHIRS